MCFNGFRVKITLQPTDLEHIVLPIDYQYVLGSSLYHAIAHGNAKFAEWLHREGYGFDNKRFKMFTYSNLTAKKYIVKNDRLIIQEPPVTFQISVMNSEIAEHLVNGAFRKHLIELADRKSKVSFYISTVEILPEVDFENEMVYKLITPCVISYKSDRGTTYYSPADKEIDYTTLFINNIINKYKIVFGWTYEDALFILQKFRNACSVEVLTPARSKLITIKANSQYETKVRGFLYTFKFKAPVELHRIGYYAGFGEKNSMGFGWTEVVC
ncbi:MAG TPA: CRISPR-associated endoribonuclease Cas6 [Bacteroidales bacterium]|nr:CRISPR-associated endoribonuclease Cas6 [Bacteroidales bacterium]HPO65008.1 CRISPR-associated endoribonuclease Cas6 [Bacteroidales bacterium]